MKNKSLETPECAAFPILRLNAGAQITHGGQVQRLREKKSQRSEATPAGVVLGTKRTSSLKSNFKARAKYGKTNLSKI